jgi:hypothetical protein
MHEAIPPLPQYVFIAWDLVKHGDNFIFELHMKQRLYQTDKTEIKIRPLTWGTSPARNTTETDQQFQKWTMRSFHALIP